jgi:ribose 1,5-bisphosphokinase PhnN
MILMQRLVVIVGTPGSGKDQLIRAIHDLGARHAQIVPKHTSRERWDDDGNEMICPGDPDYNLDACEIQYQNYGDRYGIESSKMWEGLSRGVFPVVVVSNIDAINALHQMFGKLMLLVYIHSEMEVDQYRHSEMARGKDTQYIERRVAEYQLAFDIFLENYPAFDHVLINSGSSEDLFDQIFRLFRAYERGDLFYATARSFIPERIWMERYPLPIILGGQGDKPSTEWQKSADPE